MENKYSESELKQIKEKKDPNSIPKLVDDLKEAYFIIKNYKNNKLKEYAKIKLTLNSTYHNHKETMAHAAFLIEVALFGAIMAIDKWPLDWVPTFYLSLSKWAPPIYLSQKILTFFVLFIVWISIHIFIRWQLRNRRWAAIQHAGIVRALRKWINFPPTNEDFKPYNDKNSRSRNKLLTFFDFFITCPSSTIISDLDQSGEPSGIVQSIKEQEVEGTGAIRAEYILTFGSIFIFICITFRTFWGV